MISPSLSLRQCPNRYAFRAGRNLPDKEFRDRYSYGRRLLGLRFVASQKLTTLLTFQHRAGVSPYTSPYGLAETCVLINSRLGLFTAALLGLHPKEHPFSRSYGVILPSSTRVRSLTLEFSS